VVLERDVFEGRPALEKTLLHNPLRRQQAAVFVAQAVTEIDDASDLHVGQSERLHINADCVSSLYSFVESLALEVYN